MKLNQIILFLMIVFAFNQSFLLSNIGDFDFVSAKLDRDILNSVVMLQSVSITPQGIMFHAATGFSVKYDKSENASYFVTNNHFCADKNVIAFYYLDKDDYELKEEQMMEVIALDPRNDLCILKAPDSEFKELKFRESKTLRYMERLNSIGAPNGNFPMISSIAFSGFIDRDIVNFGFGDGMDFLQISALVLHGQSGSPIYDRNGKVVGIIFATLGEFGGLAIPSESIVEFLKSEGLD